MAIEVPPPEAIPAVAASGRTSSSLISLGLLLVSVALAFSGQLTLKAAMRDIGRIGGTEVRNPVETVTKALKEPKLWFGLALFGISAVFWLVVLSRVPLSLAYPLVGFSYILAVVADKVMFGEEIPSLRWAGVAVVAVGIALIGLSSDTALG